MPPPTASFGSCGTGLMSSLLRKRVGGGNSRRTPDDEAEPDTKAPNAMKLFAKKAEAGVKASELVTSKLIQEVDAELPILDQLAKKTKQPKARIVLCSSVLAFVLLYWQGGAASVCNWTCFLVPAIMTLRSAKKPQPDDDIQWLTYW